MDKNKTNINTKALEASPMIWYKAIKDGVDLANGLSKDILPKLEFKDWLDKGIIEHSSLNLSFQNASYIIDSEYNKAIENDYYFKIGFINDQGGKIIKDSMEEVEIHPLYNENRDIFFTFRILDLNHLVSLYFHHWLIFNSFEYWVKWQLYYDFIVHKSEKNIGELYQYMWSIILGRLETYSVTPFEHVEQYKKFRDKFESILEASKYVETEYIQRRNLTK